MSDANLALMPLARAEVQKARACAPVKRDPNAVVKAILMLDLVMAALAEFERDLIRERIKSGIAAAKASGKRLGRQAGQRPSDRKATKVLKLAEAGLSYRLIGRHVGLGKNTVGAILQCARAANQRKQVYPS